MNRQIQVSVVMAVFNGEMFLKEAVDSALSQTYPNLEIILVNDGSTDSTRTILDGIRDPRVKLIHLEQNQGAATALNIGIANANGSWIAINDADDNSYPNKIEEQVKYISEHIHLVGIGTLVECIRGGPDVSDSLLKRAAKSQNIDLSRQQIKDKIFWGCPLTHSSVMFSKDVFWEVGGYNPEFKIAYDYDLWFKLLEKGEIEKVPKVLLQYRVYKNSLSNRDRMKTVNEIQIASSQAIYRRIYPKKSEEPRVIVIGPKPACKNYQLLIGPASSLKVDQIIYEDWKKQTACGVKRISNGEVEAIIVLDSGHKAKDLSRLLSHGLKLNHQVFNLYNILH